MINLIKRFIVPPIGRYLINAISSTLNMKVIGYQNYQYIKEMGKKCVIVFWHGQQFYPIYHFRNHKIAIMVSLSNDGEIQNNILSSFGYEVVRGSSSRGAVSGLIGLIKKMREGSDVAIALDGPRGPYQTAKEGVNYIAIKEDCFVLPIACAFNSYKQFGAWDKYMLPYPYSSGVMLVGRPIMPNKLNIAAMTHKHLEKLLISMSEDAKKILAGNIKPAAQVQHNSEPAPSAIIIPAITETEVISGDGDENAADIIMPGRTQDADELPITYTTEPFAGEYDSAGGDETAAESSAPSQNQNEYDESEFDGAADDDHAQSTAAGIINPQDHIYTFKADNDESKFEESLGNHNYDENDYKNNDSDNDDDGNDDNGPEAAKENIVYNGSDSNRQNKIKLRKKNKAELID